MVVSEKDMENLENIGKKYDDYMDKVIDENDLEIKEFYSQFGISELLAFGWLDEKRDLYKKEGISTVEIFIKIKKEVEEKLKRPIEKITPKDLYDYLVGCEKSE